MAFALQLYLLLELSDKEPTAFRGTRELLRESPKKPAGKPRGLWPGSWCGTRPRSWCSPRCRRCCGRCRRCCRSRCCCRWCRRRRRTRTHRAIKDFHRSDYVQATVVAACFPDVIGTIGVGCEVTPSNCEWKTHRPRITGWIIDLHLISGGVKIPTQDIHQVAEVNRPSVACGVGYRGNRVDGISHRVIDKCVVGISQSATCDISATTCVD